MTAQSLIRDIQERMNRYWEDNPDGLPRSSDPRDPGGWMGWTIDGRGIPVVVMVYYIQPGTVPALFKLLADHYGGAVKVGCVAGIPDTDAIAKQVEDTPGLFRFILRLRGKSWRST